MNGKEFPGLHLIGDFYECNCDSKFLVDLELIKKNISQLVETVDLTSVASQFHKFEEGGVTGIIALAESHIAVHTWPEVKYVSTDVYVCSYSTDNRPQARELFRHLKKLFLPARIKLQELERR
tara:strand:- start:91 stop:459 length:369 start_codon:yes stop_codon:yes gene_type:complete